MTEQIPVKVLLMNNGDLGMVAPVAGAVLGPVAPQVEMGASPDWVELADAFGALGMRVDRQGRPRRGARRGTAEDGPVPVDVHVTKEENVLSDDPRGQAARDMAGLTHG